MSSRCAVRFGRRLLQGRGDVLLRDQQRARRRVLPEAARRAARGGWLPEFAATARARARCAASGCTPEEKRTSSSVSARCAASATVWSALLACTLICSADLVGQLLARQLGERADRLDADLLFAAVQERRDQADVLGVADLADRPHHHRQCLGRARSAAFPAAAASPWRCRSRPARPRRARSPTSPCRASR